MKRVAEILTEAAADLHDPDVWMSEIDSCTIKLPSGYKIVVNPRPPKADLVSPHRLVTALARRLGVRAEVRP